MATKSVMLCNASNSGYRKPYLHTVARFLLAKKCSVHAIAMNIVFGMVTYVMHSIGLMGIQNIA